MSTRREFLQSVAAIAAAGGLVPDAIRTALAIEPEPGSTVFDAEHVVILMQENRSFDHAFGSLSGVRGFNDPHPIALSDGNPVWVQAAADGKQYAPFRLDIKKSNSTWLGCLPHGWSDQVDAANGGKHDRWLHVKKSGKYPAMPLTLGYHTREDLPFYYALADAFTICDQNFCSTLTGTTPNRLHLMTGTCRPKPEPLEPALVRNEHCDYGSWCDWTTFPERLEDHGVSWKIYQNELTVPTGLSGEADAWLSNFGCNPIEWFTQFNVRCTPKHTAYLDSQIAKLPAQIEALEQLATTQSGETGAKTRKRAADLAATLEQYRQDRMMHPPEKLAGMSPKEKSLHTRAFTTNSGDPAYREVVEHAYKDGATARTMKVPKGDVLHQFRKDVAEGTLPTVSWIVPPEQFSDHPCTAWYGQWYLSEVMDILTKNPKVWQKTVFILTYDENDGYFDHVPPFQAPHPKKPESGKASAGLDTTLDHLEVEVDRKKKPTGAVRGNSLGLGYRVPMIIASPWSRGGAVCSQVFDHTSVIRFLETLLTKKTGRTLNEPNITAWRRTVCGDLTSAFQTAADSKPGLSQFVNRDDYLEAIHNARYQTLPGGYHALSAEEIVAAVKTPRTSTLPRQEPGVRKSAPLPYELAVNGQLNAERTAFTLHFAAGNTRFTNRAAGSPFIAYARTTQGLVVRHYAVAAGHTVDDAWPLELFEQGQYHVRIHGPNGFFREFTGTARDANAEIGIRETLIRGSVPSGDIAIVAPQTATIFDHTKNKPVDFREDVVIPSSGNAGWYDVTIRLGDMSKRYAGRVETGRWTTTDPAIS